MKSLPSRRNFLQTLLPLPLLATGLLPRNVRAETSAAQPSHKFKLSLNLYSFNRLLVDQTIDLFDVLDFCAEYNFDAVDPTGYYFPGYPAVPSDAFINRFKRQAFLLGLDISGTGIRNDFSVADPVKRQADIELIKQWIVAAEKLGIPNLRVFPGNGKETDVPREKVFDWMAKDLRVCCAFGKQHGVMIALQNHNGFLKTADDVNRMFEKVDSEWMGLNLDIGSYRQNDPYQEVEATIHHAITWQIKENVWIDGKETPTDFVRLFNLIKKAGYRGYLPLETLGPGDPYQKVPVLLEQVESALKALGE